jgi:diguanylate cyclase (GGDEF)-like protein/PAS domain S-box-containing protein
MILLGLIFSNSFAENLEKVFNIQNFKLFYFGLISVFAIILTAWFIVIYRFRIFHQNLLKTEAKRKITEESLKSSELRVRELLENANDLIYTTDLAGNFTSLNKVGETLTGYTREEACAINIKDVIAPEYLDLARQMTNNKLKDDSTTRYEIEILTKSKERIIIELSSRLIYEGENPIGVQGIARDVTVRRRDEEALRKSEAKYRSLIDSLPAIVYVIEPESPYKPVYVSPNIETLGYSQEIWASVPDFWNQIIHPADRERIYQQNEEALNEKFEKELEYRIFAGDGSIHWIYDRGRFVKDETDKKIYWQGVMLDITDSKIAEEAIRKSEESYRFLSEGIIHQVWTACPKGKIDYVNERMIGYFDCPSEKVINEGWQDFIHPDDLPNSLQKWNHSLETGEYFEFRFRLRRFDGEYRWHQVRATPGLDASGKIIKWFGTNTDVDEQIRSDAALRESELKFRTLLENMGEGLVQVNNDSNIEFVNERFCKMTGYEREELLGKKTFDLMFDDESVKFLKERNQRRLGGLSENYELGLKHKSGKRLWVLVGGAPTYDENGSIIGSMGVFTDITERKRSEEKLMHDAFHDALTGLANRALFTDHLRLRIERAKRENNALFGVLFLDFDRFKVINDSLGHAEGDKLLIAVAQRLETTLRSSDLIARLGGDEFTILLNELDEPSHASQIATRIQELLKAPFELEGGEIFMSASIGIALGTDGKITAEDMIRNADIAMYRAKSKGKARHQVFDQAMHDEALSQLQIETDLRQALGRNEFRLHYQPIFDLDTKTLVGFEALIRWQHPKRGMVPPNEFIPIVEENGLIIPLGRWIIYESCRQMREWQDTNPGAANLTMSVNLSCKQFLQLDLAEQVMAMLVATRLEPEFLKLEITESHVMENGDAAVKMMNRLRSLGIELSLDDFGTGYSSLSYLHRLPVTNLKIDRSFVNQMVVGDENSKLVSTIITLAHNLNINVTAEGIETADQLEQLKELNCEKGQGYYFSKPLEAEAATELINNLPIPTTSEITRTDTNLDLIG